MLHSALTNMTQVDTITNDLMHVELGVSRRKHDATDVAKVVTWFGHYNPFQTGDSRLISVSSGIAASVQDSVNCDTTDDVGSQIMKQFDDVSFTEVSLKKRIRLVLFHT